MSVPGETVSGMTAEEMLEKGIDIPDDPVEIERLLTGEVDAESEAKVEPGADEKTSTDKPDDTLGDKKEPDDKTEDSKVDKAEDGTDKSETDKVVEEPEVKEPPGAVLKATRESLHKTETTLQEANARVDKLETELAAAKAASTTDKDDLQTAADTVTDVKIDDLTPEKIAEIREDAGDAAANLLEAVVKQNKAINSSLQELQEANQALADEREDLQMQNMQKDIDSVPLLAVLHAERGEESDTRWARVVDYEKAVKADPDWQDKPRAEVYAEVGKRMAGYLGPETVKSMLGETAETDDGTGDKKTTDETTDTKVDEALKRADESATPTSLSDLPAGQAAFQSENERANSMSTSDIEDVIAKAYEKDGSDGVNEALEKLMTTDPG